MIVPDPAPEAAPEVRPALAFGPDPGPDLDPGFDGYGHPLGTCDFCVQTFWYLRKSDLRDRHSIRCDQRVDSGFN